MKKFSVLLIFAFGTFLTSIAQSNPNPCSAPNYDCQVGGANGIVFSVDSDTLYYAAPGTSMPFWAAAGDTVTGVIDSTVLATFNILKLSGPGDMEGLPGTGELNYYGYYNELNFTLPGIYQIEVIAGGGSGFSRKLMISVLPEIDFCVESPAGICGVSPGNEIFAKPQLSTVIPVDAVFPVTAGLIDSTTGVLDSTFSGTIYVGQLSGPGILYGTLSMSGDKWFHFNDIRFTEEGIYEIIFYEEDSLKYKNAELEVEVVDVTGNGEINESTFIVFPNPIKNHAIIELGNDVGNIDLKVHDLTGTLISQKNLSSSSSVFYLELSGLPNGVYFLSLSVGTGLLETKKIVINK